MPIWTAESIRALRLALGLSRPAFAQLVGVSLNTIYRWETGSRSPAYGQSEKGLKRAERLALKKGTL